MDDYDNDSMPEYDGDSDEDTEDASETESMKYQEDGELGVSSSRYDYVQSSASRNPIDGSNGIKEQIYKHKLAELKNQLATLEKGTHPDYVKGMKSIEKTYNDRIFFTRCIFELEQKIIDNDYEIEKTAAEKEFEERNSELVDNLVHTYQDKKKMLLTDSNIELILHDTTEPKTFPTRKLRRRPNEPIPLPDRRRRTPPAQISTLR